MESSWILSVCLLLLKSANWVGGTGGDKKLGMQGSKLGKPLLEPTSPVSPTSDHYPMDPVGSSQSGEEASSCSTLLPDQTRKGLELCTGVHYCRRNFHRGDAPDLHLKQLSPRGGVFSLGEIE